MLCGRRELDFNVKFPLLLLLQFLSNLKSTIFPIKLWGFLIYLQHFFQWSFFLRYKEELNVKIYSKIMLNLIYKSAIILINYLLVHPILRLGRIRPFLKSLSEVFGRTKLQKKNAYFIAKLRSIL